VAEIVRFARTAGLRVAGQTTGHNAGPLGDLSGTILVRTSGMGGVAIDARKRIARVGAGVLWEDVVDAAAPHGLYALHGSSPTVGVAGYSLGGGMGWLARSHGLQTNSLTAIELVTADGELVRTDADHDPELFWALRGGGGNFGIVTALEFRLYELTEVYAGFMVWDWTQAARVLPVYARWAATAPDHVTTSFRIMQLPPLPEIPEAIRGRSIVIIDGAVQGDPAVIDPLRTLAPEIDTFATIPAPALVRLHQDPEEPMPYVGDTALVDELPPEAIDALIAHAGPQSGSPLAIVELRQLGGALARRAPGHGAVGGIDAEFVLFLCGMALDADMGAFMKSHIGRVKAALEPWSGAGHYLNFAEEPVDVSLTHSRDTLARLRAVKARVDPHNLIHANHAI
jgi:FAD/FMN-containing dehydrogenase